MIKRGIRILAFCMITLLGHPAEGQEPTPVATAATGAPLGFHFERRHRKLGIMRIASITKDEVWLQLNEARPIELPGHIEKFRVGSILPYSDYVITRLSPKRDTRQGITRDISEIGLRDSQTGREFTYKSWTDEDDLSALLWIIELVRNDSSRLQVTEDQQFDGPANFAWRYKVIAIKHDGVTVRRLSDGREFEVPWPRP